MTDTLQNPANLTGNVMFYGEPEPLTVEKHGKLGVNQVDKPYAFVNQSNIVPLTVTEFAPASLAYPVVFVGANKSPVAVMGLRNGENLFVDAAGDFRSDAYIPAYVRRYPFVFANDDQQQRMILCIDRSAPFVAEGGLVPLFVDGQPSDYTKQAMEFCTNFEQERRRTEAFVQLMNDLDLFEVRESSFTPRDERGQAQAPIKLADYYAVSEQKLMALPSDKLTQLRDNGALGQIYAHMTSLLGWDRLIAMAFQRAADQPTPPVANA